MQIAPLVSVSPHPCPTAQCGQSVGEGLVGGGGQRRSADGDQLEVAEVVLGHARVMGEEAGQRRRPGEVGDAVALEQGRGTRPDRTVGVVTTVAPHVNGTSSSAVSPRMWNHGATARVTSWSSTARARAIWRLTVTSWRWVSMTPLGSPVVPLEYGSRATESQSIVRHGASARLASSSASGHRAGGLAEHDDPAHPERPGPLGELGHRDEHRGAGVAELGGDLVVAPRRVDAGDGRAEPHRRQRARGDRRHVRRPHGEAVAWPEAVGVQPGGDAVDPSGELPIGHRLAARAVDEGRAVGMRPGGWAIAAPTVVSSTTTGSNSLVQIIGHLHLRLA